MNDKKYRCLHTFNELADLIRYGDLINSYCLNVDDCQRTLDIIKRILERMTRLKNRMEES